MLLAGWRGSRARFPAWHTAPQGSGEVMGQEGADLCLPPTGHIQTVKGPLTVTPLHGLGHLLAPLSLGEGLDRAQHYGEN